MVYKEEWKDVCPTVGRISIFYSSQGHLVTQKEVGTEGVICSVLFLKEVKPN